MTEPDMVKLLLVENSVDETSRIAEMLKVTYMERIELVRTPTIGEGLELLESNGFDVVLVDLGGVEVSGLDLLDRLNAPELAVPTIVISDRGDRELALAAVERGAQDYLLKDELDGNLLTRSIHYAIGRFKLLAELRELSLTDPLTKLNNRRGFEILAAQQLRVARRSELGVRAFFIDLDGLKQINDEWGHSAGDRALKGAADIFKKTFRDTDVIGRLGGDEFGIVMVELDHTVNVQLEERLKAGLKRYNENSSEPFMLEFSVGNAVSDITTSLTLDELLDEADRRMYAQKLEHKKARESSQA